MLNRQGFELCSFCTFYDIASIQPKSIKLHQGNRWGKQRGKWMGWKAADNELISELESE